jgi:hypothetical protein
MKALAVVIATAGAVLCGIPLAGGSQALAQDVGIHVGPGGVYVGPHRHRCRTITTTEWRHGQRVTRTVRRCGDDRD